MSVLFWLSIALWIVALVSYALILSGGEQILKKDAGKSDFIPLEALFRSATFVRSRKLLYRTLVLSAIGAMLSGGSFLLTRQ